MRSNVQLKKTHLAAITFSVLLMGCSSEQTTEHQSSVVDDIKQSTAQTSSELGDLMDAAKAKTEDAVNTTLDTGSDLVEKASAVGEDTIKATKETAINVKDGSADLINIGVEKASELANDGKDAISEKSGILKAEIESTIEYLGDDES